MGATITALFFALTSSFFGIDSTRNNPVDFSCDPVTWANGSGMNGENFEGAIDVSCKFTGTGGGGFTQLNEYVLDQAVRGKDVKTVYSGPVAETYANLPSSYFDEDVEIGKGKPDSAVVREDVHAATDLKTRLILATFSKSIQGQGNAKYLKKTDVTAEVLPTAALEHYLLNVHAAVVVEKPMFLPGGTFEGMIRDQVTKQQAKLEKDLINGLAQHI